MPDLSVILILAGATVISAVISRSLPAGIPIPLVQIGLGYLLALSGGLGVQLNPDLFFFLFLPPLLFLDAWRIQKRGFYHDIKPILSLSMGLVVFTVLGLGVLVHWMIPAIPLPAAFALAAIVSPTDPVAISAISRTVPIPRRLMHILEGESLLNDASGLVCMRFAIVALASGSFSLSSASVSFLWLAIAGIAIGAAVSWLAHLANSLVARRLGEDVGSQILFSLLIPFLAYYLAEKANASGVLAAVAAGVVMSDCEMRSLGLATTRIRRNAIWDTLQFALNGAMFILLGEQLPHIFEKASHVVSATGHSEPYWLAFYAFVVVLALVVLRFVWVWVSLTLIRWKVQFRLVAATSLSGVRGAITLAGVLSMPLVLENGHAFPERDLIIFIAACVIIFSLVFACITLPFALHGLKIPSEAGAQHQEQHARDVAAHAALSAIESMRKKASKDKMIYVNRAADRIEAMYNDRLARSSSLAGSDTAHDTAAVLEVEKTMLLAGLRAERHAIQTETRARRLTDDVARKLIHELDLQEENITD